MSITTKFLPELFRTFESSNPVWDPIDGYVVWPMVRALFASKLTSFNLELKPTRQTDSRWSLGWYRVYKERLTRWIQRPSVVYTQSDEGNAYRCMTVVSHINRYIKNGDNPFHIVFDNLQDEMAKRGVVIDRWILGRSRTGGQKRKDDFYLEMASNTIEISASILTEVPSWLRKFSDLISDNFGVKIDHCDVWRTVSRALRLVPIAAKRLKNRGARAVLLDVWYDPRCLAVGIASHKLGLPVIDVQHGVQGPLHVNYSGWCFVDSTSAKYSGMPSEYWCWGDESAQYLRKDLCKLYGESKVFGNLELNRWRQSTGGMAFKENMSPGNNGRRILVTLNPLSNVKRIIELIEGSRSDHSWRVRMHRQGLAHVALLEKYVRDSDRSIDLSDGNGESIFSTLQGCSLHITEFSSSTIEALAMGVPTVVIDPKGADLFEDLIHERVVADGSRGTEIAVEYVDKFHVASDLCENAATKFLAPSQFAKKCIDELVGDTKA
jgi:hypothetical protein